MWTCLVIMVSSEIFDVFLVFCYYLDTSLPNLLHAMWIFLSPVLTYLMIDDLFRELLLQQELFLATLDLCLYHNLTKIGCVRQIHLPATWLKNAYRYFSFLSIEGTIEWCMLLSRASCCNLVWVLFNC